MADKIELSDELSSKVSGGVDISMEDMKRCASAISYFCRLDIWCGSEVVGYNNMINALDKAVALLRDGDADSAILKIKEAEESSKNTSLEAREKFETFVKNKIKDYLPIW